MNIYSITYKPYGSRKEDNTRIKYVDSFKLRKDAERNASQLRACGHTQVTVVKRFVKKVADKSRIK